SSDKKIGAQRLPFAVHFPRAFDFAARVQPRPSLFSRAPVRKPVPCAILFPALFGTHAGTPTPFVLFVAAGTSLYGLSSALSECKRFRERQDGPSMSTPAALPKTAEIHLAHSPDSDDAFMFYALATGKVRLPGVKFNHVLSDIESLNQAARKEVYDVTAISFYAYPFVADKYVLLDCGASFGEGYGPIVVAGHPIKKTDLAGRKIAIPGELTTSYLALKLFEPNVETVTMPFDKILGAVQAKEVEAGLLIHEGQLLFSQIGLHRVVDLGQWWQETTGLPLPLGANAIRRKIGPELGSQIGRIIRESISFALEHREAALNYALQFARDMDPVLADKFVGMYVNRWTLDYGEEGRRAVRELLARGAAAGMVPKSVPIEFLSSAVSETPSRPQ
ncbi:MAG TPA: MqnA/MqnD/SBP family protein, partial [Candidatus Acidoferrales bacterium]|nr:MqnA/MqnD/SBP family protein [Candidatus Acidoferrales bacterium]